MALILEALGHPLGKTAVYNAVQAAGSVLSFMAIPSSAAHDRGGGYRLRQFLIAPKPTNRLVESQKSTILVAATRFKMTCSGRISLAHLPTSAPTSKRERILHEAFDKFIEFGFAAVSMQQIADSANVTKATLYHHFRDKEDLFLEVLRMGSTRSRDNQANAVSSGTTLREKLISVATCLFSTERADLARLFGDLHQHVDAARQESFWKDFQRPWAHLEGPIAESVASGEISPVDHRIAARVCFGAIATQVQFARYHQDIPYPNAAMAEEIVDLLMNGLTPR